MTWLYKLAFLLLVTTCASASETRLFVVGEAWDDKGTTLLYREFHYCDSSLTRCVIEYRDREQGELARKELDYSRSNQAPGVVLEDFVADRRVILPASEERSVVVDAGFDNFVRSRWDELAGGEVIDFPFLALGREQPLTMRAGVSDEVDCDSAELCLDVALDAWVLRLLVPKIELTYERSGRRLLRYRGISNLRIADGGSPMVDIRYDYGEETRLVHAYQPSQLKIIE